MRSPLLFASFLLLVPAMTAQTSANKPASTLRSQLLEQLRSTHNKAEWFVPGNTAVAGMTAEQASWVPPQTAGKTGEHSVGQLAHHLVFWNEQVLTKLKNPKAKGFDGNNDETFTNFTPAQWSDTVTRFDAVMKGLEDWVEHGDDAVLAANASTLGRVSTHNAYHIGQIIFVRKLQGSWNPENGVK